MNKPEIFVRTDCKAIVKFYQKIKEKNSSKRRWLNFLDATSIYNIVLEHIKEKDNNNIKKQKDNSLLEKERDKYPIGSWRYKFYDFLLSHIEHIEHTINAEEIEKIDKKILEYRDKLWDDRAKLELESFCEYHRNENTIFKSTIGRLNTWLSNKLWK